MNKKNILAIFMAGIMLATTFSAISVNAANNTPVSTSVGTTTTMGGHVKVWCTKLVWRDGMPTAEGVPGVTVSVSHDVDGNIVATGTTDANGEVSFDLSRWINSGFYFTLYFSNNDYKHSPYHFSLPSGDADIRIDMQKKDISSTPVLSRNLVTRTVSTGIDVIAIS